ncbi:uncharacterized protein LOC125501642 [Athalia rosae]|uniref:uncharacterized protein LOC125501642 n=1 Tax=Athalia rosae TaxID=37344 RepID=UPI00203494A8|nr:uncharacterized protein LOC125501642 [Athalia rosae]
MQHTTDFISFYQTTMIADNECNTQKRRSKGPRRSYSEVAVEVAAPSPTPPQEQAVVPPQRNITAGELLRELMALRAAVAELQRQQQPPQPAADNVQPEPARAKPKGGDGTAQKKRRNNRRRRGGNRAPAIYHYYYR